MMLQSSPCTDDEKQVAAKRVYQHIWQQSAAGTRLGGVRRMIEVGCKTREIASARSPWLDRQDDGVLSVLRQAEALPVEWKAT